MIRSKRRNRNIIKSEIYFNFGKFEKLLDKLRKNGVEVTSVDYKVKNLEAYKEFRYYFDHFTKQEIKSYLLFYCKQLDEGAEDNNRKNPIM